ncbi:MAG: c-type cytochrome [Cyanobacteria bacterium]|jgi:cytochrome c6|nr:c-type cytochrome [Cyanobacteriota bacterium]
MRLFLLCPLLALLVLLALPWPVQAAPDGAQLFEAHCAGCHRNGGNVIRRGKTLRMAALERQGRASEAAIATIAAAGAGQMSGYGAVLGEDGVAAVAGWVWQQALADWPRA